jgi:hypothetical protein
MPKTRKDVLIAWCDKIGGAAGREMRARLEQMIELGNLPMRLDEEFTEEEFDAAIKAMEKTAGHVREWSSWPPISTWDRRN